MFADNKALISQKRKRKESIKTRGKKARIEDSFFNMDCMWIFVF